MSEFEIGGREYRVSPMSTFDQAAIAKRLFPIFETLQAVAREVQAMRGDGSEMDMERMLPLLMPIGRAIATMSDEDTNLLIRKCLGAVKRKDSSGWHGVWNDRAQQPQFEDIDFREQMQLVVAVIQTRFGGFFPASPSTSSGPEAGRRLSTG